jgi:hypothetical protein
MPMATSRSIPTVSPSSTTSPGRQTPCISTPPTTTPISATLAQPWMDRRACGTSVWASGGSRRYSHVSSTKKVRQQKHGAEQEGRHQVGGRPEEVHALEEAQIERRDRRWG